MLVGLEVIRLTACPCEQVEGAGADAALAGALAAAIRTQAVSEYEKALTAVFNAGAEVRSSPLGTPDSLSIADESALCKVFTP